MAENRMAVVRLLMAITSFSMTITYVAAARSNEPMCTAPPGGSIPNGLYYYGCNTQGLPRRLSEVQKYVLSSIRNKFYNEFSTNQSGLCDRGNYAAKHQPRMTVYSYASCREGHDRQGCYKCLEGASQIVQDNCYGSSGVQASSETCCVRYDLYSFC